MHLRFSVALLLFAVSLSFALKVAQAAGQETFEVTPVNLYGWTSLSQRTASGIFVDGNSPSGFESGSYKMETGAGNSGPDLPGNTTPAGQGGKTWLSTKQHDGTKLSDIESFSYRTFTSLTSTASEARLAIAVQLQLDLDNDGDRDTTLVYEPVYSEDQGAVVKGEWQTWNLKQGDWWFTVASGPYCRLDCFVPFSSVVSTFPEARIITWYERADGYGLQLVAGQNGAGDPWAGYSGNVDGLTIGLDDGAAGVDETVYNFEVYSAPANPDQCKNGGWKTFNPESGAFKNQGQCVSSVVPQ